MRRSYEKNPFFVDLYWQVYRRADHSKVETIYHRADTELVRKTIVKVEREELPQLLKKHSTK